MKKIEFGSDSSVNPNGSWESIGLENGVLSGELVGFFNYDGVDYVVTNVGETFTKSEFEKDHMMVNSVLADLYKDGSGNIFVDQLQSEDCKKLETLLNSESAKSLMDRGVSVVDICNGHVVSQALETLANRPTITALGIRHEVFEKKSEYLKNCNKSFSTMMAEMEALVAKLQALESEKEHSRGL